LDTFRVDEADSLGRERTRMQLASAGIDTSPPLDQLSGDDPVRLILVVPRGFLAG
jgi:hypothetical protein